MLPPTRYGASVGRITGEASLLDRLHRFKLHETGDGKEESNTLKDLCLKVLTDNFESIATMDKRSAALPMQQIALITSRLRTDLSPIIAGERVNNENYWKRRSLEKYGWSQCHLIDHGMRWKQLFFEKMLQENLEECDGLEMSVEEIKLLVETCYDSIFTVRFRQLLSHIPLHKLCASAKNMRTLDACYGVIKVGMQYDRMLFGLKISDATSLSKVFEQADNLTTVILSRNIIDDDLLRLLMVGLLKNNTITHLNLSHNKITDFGTHLLTKLLQEGSVLTTLDLSDNLIQQEGGRHLGRELRTNDSLQRLDLRLNRLADEGCREVLDAVASNTALTHLNLSSNGAHENVSSIQDYKALLLILFTHK